MNRLKDKVALITGAGDGIGRAMAQLFATEGASLVLAGRRKEALEKTAGLLAAEALVVATDVTAEDQVVALVSRAVERFGRIDVLLNNAAQPGTDLYLWEQTLDNWNRNLAVNLTGPMLCTREALKQSMLARRSGSRVNFSSYISWQGKIRKSHYCVSKSGIRLLTKVTALEAGPQGIRANCLVPGATSTDLLVRYMDRIAAERNVAPEEIADQYKSAAALRRINTPQQVAMAALFLASDDSNGMTGQSLSVDAGSFLVG
jgi:NAD(P)-dependent dehydrogenase (short-subunit alcohol dehydrogenase family)